MQKPAATAARKDQQVQRESAQEQHRVASLEALLSELRHADDPSRDAFSKLFAKAQKVLELDDVAIARALLISRPTVGRWARGESAPHLLGRKPALQWLAREATHRLKQHR